MADDMLSTPYVSVFDKTLKTRGRPSKYKTEEEKIQARRETAITFYYNNQDYIALQKKIYYQNNKEAVLERQRRRRRLQKTKISA
jgi:hypothetical protein